MKLTPILATLCGLLLATPQSDSASEPRASLTPTVDEGETFADAVARVNSEVKNDYGILSPTILTATKLKSAIEFAADQIADSDFPGRNSYVNTLTQIAATGRILDSIHFCFTPISTPTSHQQKDKHRDGRHLGISLNYTLFVPSDHGNRLIGLTQIVEIFQVIKTQEQREPFDPPEQLSERDRKAE